MTLAILLWASFSALVSLLILMHTNPPMPRALNVCLCCGRVIDAHEPGVCSHCAADLQEVDQVLQVVAVAPDYSVINPGDLRD